MKNAYRHGDIALVEVEKIPQGLEVGTSVLLQAGSGGNPHTFTGGTFYKKENGDFIIGYLDAKNCTLHHAEHGEGANKEAKIADGLYEVRRQVEYTPEGLRQVED